MTYFSDSDIFVLKRDKYITKGGYCHEEKSYRTQKQHVTRKISPKWGFLGFLGFLGFAAFWAEPGSQLGLSLYCFLFFGFFGFFYEGKMSDMLMDERYEENKARAEQKAGKTAITIIFIATLAVGEKIGTMNRIVTVYFVVILFAIALYLFLREYYLYRYDHDEEESGE